jgi:hypothetical protein
LTHEKYDKSNWVKLGEKVKDFHLCSTFIFVCI